MDCVLLSGGIDSLVCAESARVSGTLGLCVFVDYGHPAQVQEGWKAFAYCGSRGVRLRVVHAFGLSLGDMESATGARVVPARNALLVAAAANAAISAGCARLVVGAIADDQADYADCRPEFFRAMSVAVGIEVAAPLIDRPKAAVVRLAADLGLTSSDAWSCYGPGPVHCGVCPSCRLAGDAWRAL